MKRFFRKCVAIKLLHFFSSEISSLGLCTSDSSHSRLMAMFAHLNHTPDLPCLSGVPKMAQARRWCFMWNNYDEEDQDWCKTFLNKDHCVYAIVGMEKGETRHLQGFMHLKHKTTPNHSQKPLHQKSPLRARPGEPMCKTGPTARKRATCSSKSGSPPNRSAKTDRRLTLRKWGND